LIGGRDHIGQSGQSRGAGLPRTSHAGLRQLRNFVLGAPGLG
jgi:hypothetical protein